MSQDSKSTSVLSSLFFWLTSVLACVTILTHVAQVLGLSFRIYAFSSLALILSVSALVWIFSLRLFRQATNKDDTVLAFVLILGLAGAILALFSHRPDTDDAYYIPNAVYFLQNPSASMGFDVHALYAGDRAFTSYFYATSLPFEYIQAIVAYFLQVEYLFVYYILSPALVGSLIPLALYYLISQFVTNTKHAAFGTLMAVAVVLLLGETHRTFGNFTFTRAFQGKTLCLAVGIPLFAAATLHFFRTRSLCTWTMLFTIATAMVGLTASAIVLLPPLAFALAITFVTTCPDRKQAILLLVPYVASLSYLVLYALFLIISSTTDVDANSPVNVVWSKTFWGHAKLLINQQLPLTPAVFTCSTVLSLLLTSDLHRKFLVTWIIVIGLIALNPLVAPFLIAHVTTPNIYWRLFYLLPFPLTIGIAAAELFARSERFPSQGRIAIISLVCISLFGFHLPSSSTSIFRHNVEIDWPRYKLNKGLYKAAKQMIAIAPAGPMLAPRGPAGIVPRLNSDYPQMRVRIGEVRLWLGARGLHSEAEMRIRASDFTRGGLKHFPAFKSLLEQYSYSVRSIVFVSAMEDILERPDVRALLNKHRFVHRKAIDGYIIVWN